MMRKIFVSATVTAALCSLAISVAPAVGLEFETETGESTTKSNTTPTPTIFLGTGSAGRVECSKMTMKASLKAGASTKIHASLSEFTTCKYLHGLANESVSLSTAACGITLESADLVETAEEEFADGRAKFCELEFEPVGASGCEVDIKPSGAQPEYEWLNLNGTLGHYESLVHFAIGGLEYEVKKPGSAACKTAGDSGIDGKYESSIPIRYVTIFPEF
jgi:hypothetical protein